MDSIIIFCAKYLIFVAIIVAFGYWLTLPKRQKTKVVIFAIITFIIAYILAKLGSAMFYNARPFVSEHVTALFSHGADNGFPSDHTLLAASIAFTLFVVSKRWGVGFLVVAIIIGGSRVIANVHHPIDIIGSLFFALIGGAVAYLLTPKIMSYIAKSSYAEKLGLTHSEKRLPQDK